MSKVTGVIEQVACKEGRTHPKFGKSWRTSIKVDGEWYSAFAKKPADALGLEEGKVVTFTAEADGEYLNFIPKSLVVGERAVKPAQSGKPYAARSGSNEVGIKVGHAINNAIALITSGKITEVEDVTVTIYDTAVRILEISAVLTKEYDEIVANADSFTSAEESTQPEEEEEPEEETPRKAKRSKAKPAPKPEPEEEQGDLWDDEIPFG